jgi:hypothetical protein
VPLGIGSGSIAVLPVPDSGGLELQLVERDIPAGGFAAGIPAGTQSVSLFLVNRRKAEKDRSDRTFVFQAELEVRCQQPFVARPDLRGALAEEWDEQVADLHYADTPEYATGHGISTDWALRDMWDEAQAELEHVRLFGDLVVVAFFSAEKPNDRKAKRAEIALAVTAGDAERYRGSVDERRHADPPLAPFHWEIELPEVFDRRNAGFDAIVGNPPFAGKNTVANANPAAYPDWLKMTHPKSHGNADLVAHFYRRAFDLIREDGTFGLIATNTIAQGDTRGTGLHWICTHGGEIYAARRHVKWPGRAAVTVSIVHVSGGHIRGPRDLDGESVERISAFLFHRGGDDNPAVLEANAGKSFAGFYTLGKGFTFDDRIVGANSVALMTELLKDSKNKRLIHPYMGGEELNDHPMHSPHRWVIDFETMSLAEAQGWPELLGIVEARVRPERKILKRKSLRERWWQFAEVRPGLRAASTGIDRVLATSSVSKHRAFAFVPSSVRLSHNVTVITVDTFATFAVMQSRVHEFWASFFSSSLEDRSGYRPSDCFETFPFPVGGESDSAVDAAGKLYYNVRAALMLRSNQGLTATYNRFHDSYGNDPEILRLRDLHAEMDRAVLQAYNWGDIPTACEFVLDYEIDDEEWGGKKKPYRYRWPDEVRDEVLARLVALNGERAAAERRSGLAAAGPTKRTATKTQRAATAAAEGLF